MELQYYREMQKSLEEMESGTNLAQKRIYLFGHCNATEELADLLMEKGYGVTAILDNSEAKHGMEYRRIPIVAPDTILREPAEQTIVCIVTRFYEAMYAQLRALGFTGEVRKLVDYNTYAEYSLSRETLERKKTRVEHGRVLIDCLEKKYPGHFRVFCPFAALGDVYFCMSYLPYFLEKRGINKYMVCVPSGSCVKVAELFDECPVEVMQQRELDAAIQAELYIQDENAFIAHQDRPYVVNLSRALYHKRIPLEKVYRCGVFGLSDRTEPNPPMHWKPYPDLNRIEKNRAVILSPYAKSVTALPAAIWQDIVAHFRTKGYQIFTNVTGAEQPLEGTMPVSPQICEMRSVVEQAGTFIGIRSGICDVIRTAECRKIALYPDYNYCDTKWKSIDIYAIEGFENIVVTR